MNKTEQTRNEHLKRLLNAIQEDDEMMGILEEVVRNAESTPYSTRNNYGKYLGLLTSLKPQLGLDNAVQLLIMAGGNRRGVVDASNILK